MRMEIVKNQKGSITVFLLIIFLAMLLLTGLLIDLARIRVAQNQLRRVVNASVRSVMANYNSSLKNEYGIFALSPGDHERSFQNYVIANLFKSPGQNFDMFDYKYESSALYLTQPLSDTGTLKRQILDDMKYTAPLEISKDLIEKFKSVGTMAGVVNGQNEKRKRAKNINNKINDISEINRRIKTKKDQLKNDKHELTNINKQIAAIEGKLQKSPEDRINLERLQDSQRRRIQQIEQTKNDIQDDLAGSQSIRKEIQDEIDRFDTKPGTLNSINEINPVGSIIQENISEINNLNADAMRSCVAAIEKDAQQAGAALNQIAPNGDVNEGLLERINLNSADAFCAQLKGSTEGAQQSLIKMISTMEAVYKTRVENNPMLRGVSVQPKRVENLINPFGTDESDRMINSHEDALNGITDILSVEKKLIAMRDELYINEYALNRFSYLTSPRGNVGPDKGNFEAEYILYGSDNPVQAAIGELYTIRFTLDTAAYFIFSKPPAPAELLSRTVYSLIMGAVQASLDTYRLLADGNNTVAVAEMIPDNPLDQFDLNLSYKDHLRLFMLLHSDEAGKLSRILSLIQGGSKTDLTEICSLADGSAGLSIKMWFLPLTGIGDLRNGPFGTEIRNGRCYLTKGVEFGY